MHQQQVVRQRKAARPRSAVAGCVGTLVAIVAVVIIVSVVYVLLLGHPL